MTSNQFENSDYKKTLLKRLLDGVKSIQSRFGSRSELATEDEESVTRLCSAYEDVFSHGFKRAVQQSSSSNKASFWVPAVLRSSEASSFWPLVKSQLSKHEAERFLLLHNVRTDVGRCRAWIRAALNEHSLERYILIILSLQNLHEFYEQWAFLRDHELNAILPQTAAGLGSVLFALTVDNPKLDTLIHVMERDVPEATVIDNAQDEGIEVADQAILALSPASLAQKVPSAALLKTSGRTGSTSSEEKTKGKNCKKKKKKPPVNVVSFDDDDDDVTGSVDGVKTAGLYSSLPATTVSTPTEKLSHSFCQEEESTNQLHPNCTLAAGQSKVTHRISNDKIKMTDTRPQSDRGLQPEAVKDSENESSEPSIDTPFSVHTSSVQVANDSAPSGADPSICSTSVKSVDCISINSMYSDCSERLDLDSVNLAGLEVSPSQRLKPIVNDIPGGSGGGSTRSINSSNPDFSHDLIPVPSYDSTLAPELHLDVETQFAPSSKIQSPATPITPGKSVGPTVPTASTHKDNLDTSVTSLENSSRNEDAIQKLKAILDREIETVATLRAELAEEKRSSNNQIKIMEAKIESLSKENEILRHQLKKYVGAVQLLKREGSRRLSLEEDDNGVNNCAVNDIDDSSQEAAEYERKLIQVAEMHGELMEFNAHLQKTILKRDVMIRRLKEELVDLRGPLATPTLGGGGEDDDDDDSWDIVESFSSAENSRSRSAAATARRLAGSGSNERVLINIWIPSAFLTGATNDLHHVYQVFVRIKDTEWNIYRRYSQFFSLHRDLSKNDSVTASLYFPPKKHLGNKDVKFVDERRRKLQDYLRAVMNHTLQTNSVLASHPEKNLLISILPFFGESFNTQTQKPKRERSRTRNLFFRQSGQVPGQGQPLQFAQYPQYTGL